MAQTLTSIMNNGITDAEMLQFYLKQASPLNFIRLNEEKPDLSEKSKVLLHKSIKLGLEILDTLKMRTEPHNLAFLHQAKEILLETRKWSEKKW